MLLLGNSASGKSQSRKLRRILTSIFFFFLLVAFTLLAVTVKAAAQTQNRNGAAFSVRSSEIVVPYRSLPASADPGRIGSPNFEAMEAQARLAQAQQRNAAQVANNVTVAAQHPPTSQPTPQQFAQPDAPDQSDLLRNSRDPDFILKNFHTMWVDARDAQYFDSYQMKAALGRNKEFRELNIQMVDDPRVADVLLKVGYTFAWDYPFQLKHRNTTVVLLAGKGVGPFSGPLGAADVAREFVKSVKRYRTPAKAK